MKRIAVGILAHVDSGKTTLSEALLYTSGAIRSAGRVDKGNAFLDTFELERERGITIFSKQAVITLENTEITLLDTPGHVDFSSETERTLQVLDYAILVISGTDGVQPHTKTLWHLLDGFDIPTLIFVNKTDLMHGSHEDIMKNLTEELSASCVSFSDGDFFENAAVNDEFLMEEFLSTESLSDQSIARAIRRTAIYPVFFGSALKIQGVSEFLSALDRLTLPASCGKDFGARVFKISDDNGKRLTHMKITGGELSVRESVFTGNRDEKITELRIYSGEKYQSVQTAVPGQICAAAGPSETFAGQGLGNEENLAPLTLEPVFSYNIRILDGTDAHTALRNFKKLEEEETQLHIVWNEYTQTIGAELMGEVQAEVLVRIVRDRFNMSIGFDEGSIIYKETITAPVEGVGHYEPLRHYAEVHLLMEPGERGSGLVFKTDCSEDVLDKNWQRLILTHLKEKTHLGVLTGSPITDMKITVVSGRAHLKHTEGGDFRQATYRAVRHGLMRAESVLLEPYYRFSLYMPQECIGRAMTDIERRGGTMSAPEIRENGSAKLSGRAAVSQLRGYRTELTGYTHGLGKMICVLDGWDECVSPDEVIKEIGYNAEADIDNTADSVFCSHGAGYTVHWDEVEAHMHLEPYLKPEKEYDASRGVRQVKREISEEELTRIFEMTYGKIEGKNPKPMETRHEPPQKRGTKKPRVKTGKTYMLVDGYNIIFSWGYLSALAKDSLEEARKRLTDRLQGYAAITGYEVIAVFDAYKVKGNTGSTEKVGRINIVYTKEAETADSYIEKATHELSANHRVMVATSDYMEQLIILGNGALRIPAQEFLAEVEASEAEVRRIIEEYNRNGE